MKLEQRIDLLSRLGEYCLSTDPAWEAAKRQAHAVNGWFIPDGATKRLGEMEFEESLGFDF